MKTISNIIPECTECPIRHNCKDKRLCHYLVQPRVEESIEVPLQLPVQESIIRKMNLGDIASKIYEQIERNDYECLINQKLKENGHIQKKELKH